MTLYIQMFHSKLQDPPKQIRGEALNPLAHVLPFPPLPLPAGPSDAREDEDNVERANERGTMANGVHGI